MTQRRLFQYSIAFTTVFFSCQPNESENSSEGIEDSVSILDIAVIDDTTFSKIENPLLFEHYYDICQSEKWPEFVDGAKIIKAYDNYPNPKYEGGFEWEVKHISDCTDSLICLQLQSFEEGLYKDYDVDINFKGIITKFEITAENHIPQEEGY